MTLIPCKHNVLLNDNPIHHQTLRESKQRGRLSKVICFGVCINDSCTDERTQNSRESTFLLHLSEVIRNVIIVMMYLLRMTASAHGEDVTVCSKAALCQASTPRTLIPNGVLYGPVLLSPAWLLF